MYQSALRSATQRQGMRGSTPPTLTWGKVVGRNTDGTWDVPIASAGSICSA